MASLKRKSTALDGHRASAAPLSAKTLNHTTRIESIDAPMKKPKLSNETNTAYAPTKSDPTDQLLNFYCHQCSRKRDRVDGIQCTFKPKNRCKIWYCKACLKNRYGLEIRSLKAEKTESTCNLQHVDDSDYLWKCPKCCDNCNCHRCRKSKGLPPTGQLKASELQNPQMLEAATSGYKLIPEVVIDINPNATRGTAKKSKSLKLGEGKAPEQQVARKRRKISPPSWTEVPTDLDRDEAEQRFYIREFALRFASLMSISQTHLEDLDEFDNLSDACAKSLIINLIDLVAADVSGVYQKELKAAIRRLSSAGNLPSALWNVLVELRDAVPPAVLNVVDPSPPKNGDQARTRNSSFVQRATQLIPVIIGIAECALQGASVRLELDNGAKDLKDTRQIYWDSLREEKDRWSTQKQAMLDSKAESESKKDWDETEWSKTYHAAHRAHKSKLTSLDLEYNLKVQEFSPRFQPLGVDLQGRTYYVSSVYKGKRPQATSDRDPWKKWSWFLAIWGRVTSEEGAPENFDDEDEEDKGGEKWWGFADPKEIKKLAKWLSENERLKDFTEDCDRKLEEKQVHNVERASLLPSITSYDLNFRELSPLSALSDEEEDDDSETSGKHFSVPKDDTMLTRPQTKQGVKELVKNLNDYADFLAWRIENSNISKKK